MTGWNWVGGRYSVDAAVGTSLAVVFGPERFEEFLHGFHEIDEYFANTPFEKNVVVLLGMLNVWYRNFFKVASHAVLPYDQYLHRFPAYLQQLTMESNGKSVRWDGTPVTSETGEIFWGEPGTNGQHAFYQLIHQGTQLIPADFIAFVNTPNPTKDGDQDVHELFLGNYFAQTKALAFGKTADEVRAEGTPEEIVPARVFTGNRPTTSIFGVALTPFALGELIALYEHITFVEGTVWGLDSYDQWGVELGKQLAKQITPAISQDDEALAAQGLQFRSVAAQHRQGNVLQKLSGDLLPVRRRAHAHRVKDHGQTQLSGLAPRQEHGVGLAGVRGAKAQAERPAQGRDLPDLLRGIRHDGRGPCRQHDVGTVVGRDEVRDAVDERGGLPHSVQPLSKRSFHTGLLSSGWSASSAERRSAAAPPAARPR